MAKEILLYSPIFSFTAESFIAQLNDFEDEDVTIRINSPGGSVFSGWGMIAKSQEHAGELTIKVDGVADSMTAVFLLFHKSVEALNVSRFLLHRASTFSSAPEDLKVLAGINKDIRAAFEKKIDIPKFEKIAGVTLDEFFTSEEVIDVNLTAKQAKSIKLISKINVLEAADFEALNMKFAALSGDDDDDNETDVHKVTSNSDNKNPKKDKIMDLDEFKAKYPAIHAEAVAQGVKTGTEDEKDRVGSWLAFNDVDPKAVALGIESGKDISRTDSSNFSKKMFSAKALDDTADDNADDTDTDEEQDDKTPTAASKLQEEVDKELGIEDKDKTKEK